MLWLTNIVCNNLVLLKEIVAIAQKSPKSWTSKNISTWQDEYKMLNIDKNLLHQEFGS